MTMDDFTILALWLRYILANALSCPGGETGRHSGLKIRRCRKASCRFDSGPGHQRVSASPGAWKPARGLASRVFYAMTARMIAIEQAARHWYFAPRSRHRAILAGASADEYPVECAQAQLDTGFLARREEERIERADARCVLEIAAVFGDLRFGMPEVEVKQSRRRLDPRVFSNRAERMKSQHALVKLDVAWVYLDDQVGAAANSVRMDIRGVEERGDNRLRAQRFIDGQPGEFAHPPIRPAH